MIKNILSIIGILVICTLFMGAVSAADWTVNPGDSIQSAINNASNNDTIIVNDNNGTAYTYTENLVINKTLQLKTINGTNVTIQALNPSKSIIMVYNGGSGSIIQGLTITGATNYVGIYLNQSSNCNITGNKITNNYHGIYLYKAYNTLITQNTLINNVKDGICVVNSTVNVKFNVITGNTRYGLFVLNNGNAYATNNWWGKNIPNYICSTSWPSTCDIWNQNCIVNYDPWLNLTITAPDTIHTGEDYSITADLTKDKNGNDTSSQGNIPDGIPVNFTTIIGNISTPVSTRNGKAMATLNSALKGPTLVSVNLNGQTVNKTVNILGVLNERTNEWFNTIQAAINDTDTLNGDTIILSEGTYTENIIINKKLTLKGISEGNVTIKALDLSKTVLTVNSTGNGSTIQYLTITGQTNMPVIFLDSADNCIITGNIVTNSTSHGIKLVNSNNSTISDNTITNHSWYGIYSSSSHNNTISGNTFTNDLDGIHLCGGEGNKITRNNMDDGNFGIYLYETTNCTVTNNTATNMQQNGIYLENSNYTILSENTFKYNTQNGICIRYSSNNRIIDNDITDNTYHGIYLHYSNGTNIITGNKIKNNDLNGITLYYSSADINYNIITGNTKYGLYKEGTGTSNATNNWWGTNSPRISSTIPSAIYVPGGSVSYNPWLPADIEFTFDEIKTAAGNVTTYTKTNNQLPSIITISGIQVTMPQFLKLSVKTVLNIDNELNTTVTLGYFTNPQTSEDNITYGVMLDDEFIDMASIINSYMNINGYAPCYVSNISLGDNMCFESLVYTYSQIMSSYNSTDGTLSDSVTVIPWKAISNPNKVYNFRTQEFFDTIQLAITGSENNDTIVIGNGIFTENVVVNKILKITSLFGNTIVNAQYTTLPVFTIEINGSGSIIQNLIINGSTSNAGVYINNSNNNTIFGNNITGNLYGIYVNNSTANEISANNILNNTMDGISLNTCSNMTIAYNTVKNNNHNGISINQSDNNTIYSNSISNNENDGIYLYNSSADINLNRITGNGICGLYNVGNGTVDATNNWWGTNNQAEIQNSVQGNMSIDQWIVLSVTSSHDHSVIDKASYIITADLTHNNNGDDTSSGDSIPDGIPVNFTTTFGTITPSASTRDGKAITTLNSTTNGTANISIMLDNQIINKTINVTMMGAFNNRTNENFTSIQAAINDTDTRDGDTILLRDGTYTENIIVTKRLTIKPVDGDNVIIQAAESDDESDEVDIITITSTGSGSIIQGLNIKGTPDAYGIFLDTANNCNINGNTITDTDCGIYLFMSNNNTIIGNIIRDNYYGIGLYNSTNNSLSGNNITDNYYGIYFDISDNNSISENNLTDNWNGIKLYQSNNSVLSSNNISGNWIGSYLYKLGNITITENIITNNGCGICFYNSNNTTTSENNISENWVINTSYINSNDIIIATTIYSCGPAALATVMKNLGINATELELAILSNTTETGTTMLGLKQAAIDKGFLNTKGYKLTTDQLQANYIVVLKINGNYHYNIIRSITSEAVYLTDPNLGNIQMNITQFNELFIRNLTDSTGYVLIVTNSALEVNGTLLTDEKIQNIKAMAYKIVFCKKIWVKEYWYKTKKWVNTSHYEWKRYLVWVKKHFEGWKFVYGHYEWRWKKVWVKSGYYKTTWHYKKGYWKTTKVKVNVNSAYIAAKFASNLGLTVVGIIGAPETGGVSLVLTAWGVGNFALDIADGSYNQMFKYPFLVVESDNKNIYEKRTLLLIPY